MPCLRRWHNPDARVMHGWGNDIIDGTSFLAAETLTVHTSWARMVRQRRRMDRGLIRCGMSCRGIPRSADVDERCNIRAAQRG